MSYRNDINNMIRKKDLRGLLKKSAEFHGHICSHSTYGVKAGCYAMRELALTNEGMEEVIAIVETNNCFSDGIQLATGCTFGNNALIFNDLGKTAVTVINRKSTESIRLSLNRDFWASRKGVYPEVFDLFDKIVARREKVSGEQRKSFFKLTEEMALSELGIAESDMFDIEKKKTNVPKYAPIFDSVICSKCGEPVMESRARIKDGKPVCITCMDDWYFSMDGYGVGYKK